MSSGLATTFRPEEVTVMVRVADQLQRGGDVSVIVRRPEWGTLVEKFRKLDRKAKEEGL